ncbi:TonB-dependent receptor SusC, partial [termite gut metagenome]
MERNLISGRRIMPYLLMCLTFLFFSTGLYAQNVITVEGQVLDKGTNDPVIGVSIIEKGTSNGTITDLNGNFTFKVKQGAVITFTSIGYKRVEQPARQGGITVYMEEDSETLDEVVVVGYGVQKKVNLTGSVATVGASKLESRAMPNLSTSLTGLAAGMSVRQGSGNPGDDGANIRVRGIGTFDGSSRSPMVVIDGAIADINSVNPEDVESISVLKDAASSSIYGSRGANGVILVTTKKGKTGAAPRVTYTGIYTQEKASSSFELLSDYADYMELFNMAQLSSNPKAVTTYSQEAIDGWRNAKNNPNGI